MQTFRKRVFRDPHFQYKQYKNIFYFQCNTYECNNFQKIDLDFRIDFKNHIFKYNTLWCKTFRKRVFRNPNFFIQTKELTSNS